MRHVDGGSGDNDRKKTVEMWSVSVKYLKWHSQAREDWDDM